MGQWVSSGLKTQIREVEMSIVHLHSSVLADHRDFVRSFPVIADALA